MEAEYSAALQAQARSVLPIRYETYVTQAISLPTGSTEANICTTCAFSEIQSIYASFVGSDDAASNVTTYFLILSASVAAGRNDDHVEQTLEWMFSLGALQYPTQHCRSMPQTLGYPKEAVRSYSKDTVEMSISKQRFADKRFVIGVNLQTSPTQRRDKV